jgi:hypothetical protein
VQLVQVHPAALPIGGSGNSLCFVRRHTLSFIVTQENFHTCTRDGDFLSSFPLSFFGGGGLSTGVIDGKSNEVLHT